MWHKKVLSALTALAIAAGMTSVPVLAEEKLNATAVISGEDTSVFLSEKVSGVVIGVKFENEVLKGIKTAEITDGNQAVLEDFEANMVYVWDSLDGMEPLCDPVTPSDATIETEAPTATATEAPTEAAREAPSDAPAAKTITVDFTEMSAAEEYTAEAGQGFMEYSSAIMPEGYARQVAPISDITVSSDGAKVTEKGAEYTHTKTNSNDGDDYNYGGMIYRVDAPAGAYHLEVEVTGSSSDTRVAPTGMDASRLTGTSNWDN